MLVWFSITPLDKGGSVGSYVSRALDVVDRSGLPYETGSMGTTIEGEWEDVFAVLRDCMRVLEPDCERISLSVKVDHRRGRMTMLADKVASAERQLGRPLRRRT